MNKTNVEEVVFDGDVNSFTQLRLAQWMMDRKRFVYNSDIKIVIKGVELDTVACDSVEDIMEKYQPLFERMGIPNYED